MIVEKKEKSEEIDLTIREKIKEEVVEKFADLEADGLRVFLAGNYLPLREEVGELFKEPLFDRQFHGKKETNRTQIYKQSQRLAEKGYGLMTMPAAYGGKEDMGGYIALFEMLAFHDLSLTIKFGVQFGLFAGSIYLLGTEKHHQAYLNDAGTLKLAGCFAMTELGHGSNVRDIETTVVYDQAKDQFILHTPTESASKAYIGNAAVHGQMATVFAQLEVNGEQHGVHAFLVPIRSKWGRLKKGVRIEDNGEKLGLNGVDNGRIWFDQVVVPRENMLDRFASITEDGIYQSSIENNSKRFFMMLSTLVGGRVCVGAGALSATKVALAIAIKYGNKRRQFGPSDKPETILLDYQTHQRRLLIPLAKAYGAHFAQEHLSQQFVEYSWGRLSEDQSEIETFAAGLKAHLTSFATEVIQECREACGGQGYMWENQFATLKADSDVFTTFEGDNTVLMQLVARGLLTEFREQFEDINLRGWVSFLSKQAGVAISELNPIITRRYKEEHLRSSEFHLSAFRYRLRRLQISAATRLKKRIDDGIDFYDAFVACQSHLVTLGEAYIELVVLEQYVEAVERCPNDAIKPLLEKLANLHALATIEKHRGWYLEKNYIEGVKSKAITRQVEQLCLEIRPFAEKLVDGFGIPKASLTAPIAQS